MPRPLPAIPLSVARVLRSRVSSPVPPSISMLAFTIGSPFLSGTGSPFLSSL